MTYQDAMELGRAISQVTKWCEEQGPGVTWTLMSTSNEGRTGFQLFVTDHEHFTRSHGEEVCLYFVNTPTLANLADAVEKWIGSQ